MEFLQFDDQRTIGWRNPHGRWDLELSRELSRKQALASSQELFGPQAIQELFLFDQVYERLRTS